MNAVVLKEAFCPLVSIGMPVFNCEKTLAVAIRSILNQTYSNWQLLLMDDGSTDRTLEVARSFDDPRISVFTDHSHKGLVPRLNQAIEMSRGEYFARMDGDDVAYPERLELQVRYLEEHPDIDLAGSGILVFKGEGHPLGTRPLKKSHAEICRHPWGGFDLPHPTWIGRAAWFRAHGYRPELVRAEDQGLLLRTYSASRFACLPNILLGYREESISLRKTLGGRYKFSRALIRHGVETGGFVFAVRGILEQALKSLVDVFAVSTGGDYRILRHRATPLDQADLRRWTQVWTQVQNGHIGQLSGSSGCDAEIEA